MSQQPAPTPQPEPKPTPKLDSRPKSITSNSVPRQLPLPANDNKPLSARIQMGLLNACRLHPAGRAIVFAVTSTKDVEAWLEQRKAQQQEQEKGDKAIPPRGRLEIMEDKPANPSGRQNQSLGKSQSVHRREETSRGRRGCFEKEDYGIDRPLSNNRPQRQQENDPFLARLQQLGNTREQEARLLAIYQQVGQTRSAQKPIEVYRNYMSQIALKQGRQMMDREQDPQIALKTDQQAFQVMLARTENYQDALDAIVAAS
ncbi:MAG: hypothetical protein AAFY26_19485, partial [Cyanobacteria bacterium J06638_22]